MRIISRLAGAKALLAFAVSAMAMACSTTLPAQSRDGTFPELGPGADPTYADLVSFSLAADVVAIVDVEDAIAFPPERAPDVPPGRVRLYVESLMRTLLAAPGVTGESLVFVTDTNRERDGRVPDWEDRAFVVFADDIPGRPGEIQLVSSRAILPHGPVIEERLRRVLRQLADPSAPPAITGIRDVISVQGNLAGESETQMFVETATGAPVSLSVIRRPGMRPQWGVSLGEIVDTSARPPERESLAWYRFACFLPRELPADSFPQSDRQSRAQAQSDYAFVLEQLGPCERRFT